VLSSERVIADNPLRPPTTFFSFLLITFFLLEFSGESTALQLCRPRAFVLPSAIYHLQNAVYPEDLQGIRPGQTSLSLRLGHLPLCIYGFMDWMTGLKLLHHPTLQLGVAALFSARARKTFSLLLHN
jgi:hypothetical protein